MKALLINILLILLSTPFMDLKNEFLEEVDKAYSQYRIIEDYTSPYYSISIIEGIIDDELYFGVMFFSENAKDYYINLTSSNTNYNLKQNKRGDYNVIAFQIKKDFKLEVFDNKSNSRKSIELKKNSTSDFLLEDNIIEGRGEGAKIVRLQKDASLVDYVLLFSGIIVVISGIYIFILYKTKKGLFNPNKKTQQATILNKIFKIEQEEIYEEPTKIEEIPFIKSPEEANTSPSYESHYRDLYEEEERTRDYTDILLENNIVLDYSQLNASQKDQTMLKLMYLRDQKKLSLEEYRQEVIKLWKE